jgi:hypothetical protein
VHAGLAWFTPSEAAQQWPRAPEQAVRLGGPPLVVVAWVPAPAAGDEPPRVITKAARAAWVGAIRGKLERSGLTRGVVASPPETLEDGVTLERVRALADAQKADLVVLFGLDFKGRRYHTSAPSATESSRPRNQVDTIVEVLSVSRTVGLDASGRPLFADKQQGFDSEATLVRSVDELEKTASRVAVDAIADAMIRRLSLLVPERRSP